MSAHPYPPILTPPSGGLVQIQKYLGWCTMGILLLGFALLVDGLTAEMQRGPNRLDVLPATSTPVSGGVPVKDARDTDFLVDDLAPDPDVRLVRDDYYASYWFGSGMWRGHLDIGAAPRMGEHAFVVRFAGAPKTTEQVYRVYVWPDAAAMRAGSFSVVQRRWGLSPFTLAGVFLPLGLALLAVNFLLGRQWQKRLKAHGFAEVYGIKSTDAGMELTFGLGRQNGLQTGQMCALLRGDGTEVGRFPITLCQARASSLLLPDVTAIKPGLLARPLDNDVVPMTTPATPLRPAPLRPTHGATPLRPASPYRTDTPDASGDTTGADASASEEHS